jgi:hypothetical protein
MVFVADDALQHDVKSYLERESIEFPSGLQVTVTLHETSEIAEPSVVCRNRSEAVRGAESAAPPMVRFTLHGSDQSTELSKLRIYIGRLPEVLDAQGRPVRRNDIVLDHSTVSRAHAHIEWDAGSGEYRLFDDGSSYGTGIVHDGRLVNVPAGAGRGIRLHPGDELYLGQARVRIDAT